MHSSRKFLGILLVAPLVIVTTLLWLLTQGLHSYPLAVSNEDAGFNLPGSGLVNVPETLVKTLDANVFRVTTVKTAAEAQALLANGTVKALLTFPKELTEDMFIKQDDPTYVLPAKIQIQVVGDNPLAKLEVIAALAKGFIPAIQENGGLSADSIPIPIDLGALADGFGSALPYLVATLLGLLTSVLTGIFSMLATRQRLADKAFAPKKAPLQALGHISSFALMGTVLYVGLVSVTWGFLSLSFTAELFWAAGLVFVLHWAVAGLGLAAGTNAGERAFAVVPFLILPLFFGGFLFPAELMPTWLQWLEFVFPAHYGLAAASAVQLGHYPSYFWLDITILSVFALAFTGGSVHGITQFKETTE